MDNNKVSIYLELTDIVDTRYNVIELLSHGNPPIDVKDWKSRETDSHYSISEEIVKNIILVKRDNANIMQPRRTNIIQFVNELISTLNTRNDDGLSSIEVEILFNLKGYVLGTNELDYIIKGLESSILYSKVTILNTVSPSFEWVKKSVDIFISYYGISWLNDSLSETTITDKFMPNVTLIVPSPVLDLLPDGKIYTPEENDAVSKIVNVLPVPKEVFSYTET